MANGELVRLLGIDPFLDRTIRPEISRAQFPERNRTDPEEALSFLLDEPAVLVDRDLAKDLNLTAEKDL